MDSNKDEISQLSEAERLALFDSERQLCLAIWEHLDARSIVLECNEEKKKVKKKFIWVVAAIIGAWLVYQIATYFLPSMKMTEITEIILIIFSLWIMRDLSRENASIAILRHEAEYKANAALAKFETLVPGNAALLYNGFDTDDLNRIPDIMQSEAYITLQSALISEITKDFSWT